MFKLALKSLQHIAEFNRLHLLILLESLVELVEMPEIPQLLRMTNLGQQLIYLLYPNLYPVNNGQSNDKEQYRTE
jgi:hypothetical protein